MNFKHHKYTLVRPFDSTHHNWELVCARGAVHFHASIFKGDVSAGLEFHHLTGDGAPDHVHCPLTGGRCWHDGTSLYASETLWPMIEPALSVGDHDAIFRLLEGEAEEHFGEKP
jgi:threonine dehydratase